MLKPEQAKFIDRKSVSVDSSSCLYEYENELESFFTRELGERILISVSKDTLKPEQLNENEKEIFAGWKNEARRKFWLKGRRALRNVLAKEASLSGACDQGAGSVFPNPYLSLSHSGEYAIAAAAPGSGRGVGVDIEEERPVRKKMLRFFLSTEEQRSLLAMADRSMADQERADQESAPEHPEPSESDLSDEILRLWTVKEALFKSDLCNKSKTLLSYEIENPQKYSGFAAFASAGDAGRKFKYCSLKAGAYFISVSIAILEGKSQ